MKQGTTYKLIVSIDKVTDIDTVDSVIFTFADFSKTKILQKTYPTDVKYIEKKFNILLTQEDTVSLAGKGYIEAQINFKNKSVAKTEISRYSSKDTLATEFVEGNTPNDLELNSINLDIEGELIYAKDGVTYAKDGVTFIPNVSESGEISWSNNGDLKNPEPRNIKGPQGERGPQGEKGDNAELLDIRIGYDGKTYPTAGEAVRVQVSELKSDLNDAVYESININPTKQENRWVYDGVLCAQEGYTCYYFPIEHNSVYEIKRSEGYTVIGVGFSMYEPIDERYILPKYERHDGKLYRFIATEYNFCIVFVGKSSEQNTISVTKLESKIDTIESKIDTIEKTEITVYNGYFSTTDGKLVTYHSDSFVKKFLISNVLPMWVEKIMCGGTWSVRINTYDKNGNWIGKGDFVKEFNDFDFVNFDYKAQFAKNDNFDDVYPSEFSENVSIYANKNLYIIKELQDKVKDGWSKLEDKIIDVTEEYIKQNGLYENDYALTKNYVLCHNDFSFHGKLTKSDTKIIDEYGNEVLLQGIGTHSLSEYNALYTEKSVKTLKYYGINMIRISVYLTDFYPANSNGRLAKGWLNYSDELKPIIEKLIDVATKNNMYVLLDWHSYHSIDGGDVTQYKQQQEEFFTYFSEKYANSKNILYELHNEPYQNTAIELLPSVLSCCNIIRENNEDAIIICGCGSDGTIIANSVWNTNNSLDIFISEHLYTGEQDCERFKDFVNRNIPFFVSEWGNSSLSGDDRPNDGMTYKMFQFLYDNKISNALWKWTFQDMDTAVLLDDEFAEKYAYPFGGYTDGMLSHNGRLYFRRTFNGMIRDIL